MLSRIAVSVVLVLGLSLSCAAQEKPQSKPVELEVLKASVGVWDAEFEVWPQGLNADSVKFKGVEENHPHGEHWIASDLTSEFMGQTMKVHSIIGYDLDEKKLVGKVVDQGPYAASMTGDYDKKSKTVTWMTRAKDPSGKPMVQKTSVTQKSDNERLLVLSVPGKE